MNVDTGHLVDDINDVDETQRSSYDRIPPELQDEARAALAGRRETHVQIDRKNSKLAKWARKRRADKKKTRNAIARASRRRNRRK